MAYDELLAERIRHILRQKDAPFTDRKMMGGIMFKVDEKMLCGTHIDNKYGDSLLMVRVGMEAYPKLLERTEALPMDFTGRIMRGYLFVKIHSWLNGFSCV